MGKRSVADFIRMIGEKTKEYIQFYDISVLKDGLNAPWVMFGCIFLPKYS